ncbi:MAG: tRNA (guanosine(46)-N7)-methyltransferase TrmB [Burkholderiales bacterium]
MSEDQALMRPAADNGPERRAIRSFVLRQGRVSPAQQRHYDELMPRFGVPYQPASSDLNQLFNRTAENFLEIGFGMGETTATIAAAHPDHDYLGIEVHTPGVGALLKIIGEQGINNIRIVQHDAVEVLQHMIPNETFSGVHIFFPDPWPKTRHHKRRLIQPPFIKLITAKIKPGGYLHAATDWQEYAEQILTVLSNEPQLRNTAENYAPRPSYRPLTKFEARGLKLGHGVWDCIFKKI